MLKNKLFKFTVGIFGIYIVFNATVTTNPKHAKNILKKEMKLMNANKTDSTTGGSHDDVPEKVSETVRTTFAEEMSFRESSNRPYIIGGAGNHYLGKYQFGRVALMDIYGKKDGKRLYNQYKRNINTFDEKTQDECFEKWIVINQEYLKSEIAEYKNTTVHGIKVTEAGIIAVAHNQGCGAIKKWLKTSNDSSDAFGTTVIDYLTIFEKFEI